MANAKEKELTKQTMEQLQEMYKRELTLINNKEIVKKLPDQGKLLNEKVKKLENEIKIRESMAQLEKNFVTLSLSDEELKHGKEHVKYVCSLEKQPEKDRYKPYYTLSDPTKKLPEKQTQLIPLVQSITLLTEQSNKTKDKGIEHGFKLVDDIESEIITNEDTDSQLPVEDGDC